MSGLDQLLSAELIERLGWTLLHSLWQGTVVAAVFALLLLFIPSTRPNARYAAGGVSLFTILVVGAVTFFVIEPSDPDVTWESVSSLEAGPAIVEPMTDDFAGLKGVKAPAAVSVDYAAPVEEKTRPEAQGTADLSSTSPASAEPLSHRVFTFTEPFLPWLVLLWLLGVFALSIWHLGGWIALCRLRRIGTRPVTSEVTALVKHLSERLRVSRPVRILQSVLIQTPAVLGHFRPIILMPVSALTGLASEQIESIIAHELSHIRRYDYLVSLLQTVVETLLFHHPAVWWISHRIRVEREYCCDDLTLSAIENRADYAQALARIAESGGASVRLAVAARDGSLVGRIRRLLEVPVPRATAAGRALAGVLVIATILASGIGIRIHALDAEAQEEPADESIAPGQPKLAPRKLFSASHGADAGVLAVAFSPDGLTVAAVDEKGNVMLRDGRSGQQLWGRDVLTAEEKKLLLYKERQGRIHTAAIAFSPDGYTLAVAADPVVRLYDAQSGHLQRVLEDKRLSEELKELKRPPATVSRELELLGDVPHAHGRVYCVAFSPDGTLLATSGLHLIRADGSSVISGEIATHGKLKLWDAKTGELKRDLGEHYSFVRSVAFAPDGKTLASIGSHPPHWTRSVRLWDFQAGAVKGVLRIARGGIPCSVAFSPDGKLMAASATVIEADPNDAGGLDRLGGGLCKLLVWNARTGALLVDRPVLGLASLSFSADGKTLATGVDRRGVTLWDPETLEPTVKILPQTDLPRDLKGTVGVAFSPVGNLLAIGAENEKHGFLTVWELGHLVSNTVTLTTLSPERATGSAPATQRTAAAEDDQPSSQPAEASAISSASVIGEAKTEGPLVLSGRLQLKVHIVVPGVRFTGDADASRGLPPLPRANEKPAIGLAAKSLTFTRESGRLLGTLEVGCSTLHDYVYSAKLELLREEGQTIVGKVEPVDDPFKAVMHSLFWAEKEVVFSCGLWKELSDASRFRLTLYAQRPPTTRPARSPAIRTADATSGDEAAIRQLISKFAKAAEKGEEQKAAQLLDKRRYQNRAAGVIKEMKESIALGATPAIISSVNIRGDRALVVTDFFEFSDSRAKGKQCLVYQVVRDDTGWVIRDIDMESADGLISEIRRFDTRATSATSQPAAEERVVRVYPLGHAKAERISARITGWFATSGSARLRDIVTAQADDKTNSVIVTYHPSKQEEIEEFLDEWDVPDKPKGHSSRSPAATPYMRIQVKIIELSGDEARITDPKLQEDLAAAGDKFMQALNRYGQPKLLSRPEILTDWPEQPVTLTIGESVPVVNAITVNDKGETTPIIEHQNIGITVALKGRWLDNTDPPRAFVDIEMSHSAMVKQSVAISTGASPVTLPIFTTRTTSTKAEFEAGKPTFIGGVVSAAHDRKHATRFILCVTVHPLPVPDAADETPITDDASPSIRRPIKEDDLLFLPPAGEAQAPSTTPTTGPALGAKAIPPDRHLEQFKRIPTTTQPASSTEESAWGEAVEGVQLGLSLGMGERSYRVGETVDFNLHVRNLSEKEVRLLHFGTLGWAPTVRDSTAKLLLVTTPPPAYVPVLPRHLSLAPGETVFVGTIYLRLDVGPATRSTDPHIHLEPGTYRISQTYRFSVDREVTWSGELTSGVLELKVIPSDSNESLTEPPVMKVDETPWGESLEGVQCRLRADKVVWQSGEVPTFHVDVRTSRQQEMLLPVDEHGCRLEFDGQWYHSDADVPIGLRKIVAGEGYGLKISLGDWWQTGSERIQLTHGKHTVRVLFRFHVGAGEVVLRAISNPVEIEILLPRAGAKGVASATQPAPVSNRQKSAALVYVLGRIPRPGAYTCRSDRGDEMTILQLLIAAGHDHQNDAHTRVELMRRNGDGRQRVVAAVSVEALVEGEETNPTLVPGDILRVVGKHELRDREETAKESRSPSKLWKGRITPPETESDQRRGKAPGKRTSGGSGFVYVTGAAQRTGVYILTDRLTLLQLIVAAGGLDRSQSSRVSVEIRRRLDQTKSEVTRWDVNAILQGAAPDPYLAPNDVLVLYEEDNGVSGQSAVNGNSGASQSNATQPASKATGDPATSFEPPPTPERDTIRFLDIRVVDRKTNKPLSDVGLRIIPRPHIGHDRTDPAGRCRVAVPTDLSKGFRIIAEKAGYVTVRYKPRGHVPGKLTLKTEPGIAIGGVVKNEKGEPLRFIGMHLFIEEDDDGNEAAYYIHERYDVTDEQGRWRRDRVPPDLASLHIKIHDREGYADVDLAGPSLPPAKQLRDKTAIIVLQARAGEPPINQQSRNRVFADAIAKLVQETLSKHPLPFLSEQDVRNLPASFHEFVMKHATAATSPPRQQRIAAAFHRHMNNAWAHRQPESVYRGFDDIIDSLKLNLWMAMSRGELSHEHVRRMEKQRQWIRDWVNRLPDDPNHSRERPLAKLEATFENPLCAMFDRPMSDEEWTRFIELVKKDKSATMLPYVHFVVVQAAFRAEYPKPGLADVPLPFDDRVTGGSASSSGFFCKFESNAAARGIWSPYLNDVEKRGRAVLDMASHKVLTIPETVTGDSELAKWLNENGRGDLCYDDAKGGALIALRGAKIARLDANSWLDADRIEDDSLRAVLKRYGSGVASIKDVQADFRSGRGGAEEPKAFFALETSGKLLAVVKPRYTAPSSERVEVVIRERPLAKRKYVTVGATAGAVTRPGPLPVGRVVERVVNADSVGKDCVIDFDTGKLFEIDDTDDKKADLAERVMTVLKNRVDPQGNRNLVWRPIGRNRLEIQRSTSTQPAAQPVMTRPAAEGNQVSWGEPVEGVQVRLRPEKKRWHAGEIPTFRVDLRNNGSRPLRLRHAGKHCEAEVDGQWHQCYLNPEDISGNSRRLSYALDFSAGASYADLPITLAGGWQPLSAEEVAEFAGRYNPDRIHRVEPSTRVSLTLPPGKHVIRVAYIATPPTPTTLIADGALETLVFVGPVRAVSNPVQVEIVTADAAPDSAAGDEGAIASGHRAKTAAAHQADGTVVLCSLRIAGDSRGEASDVYAISRETFDAQPTLDLKKDTLPLSSDQAVRTCFEHFKRFYARSNIRDQFVVRGVELRHIPGAKRDVYQGKLYYFVEMQLFRGRGKPFFSRRAVLLDGTVVSPVRAASGTVESTTPEVRDGIEKGEREKWLGARLPKGVEPAALKVRYEIEGGEKKARLRLRFMSWTGLGEAVQMLTVANGGEILLNNLTPGRYNLARMKLLSNGDFGTDVFCDREFDLRLEPGKTRVVDLVRRTGQPITGRISGLPDNVVPGVFVYIKSAEATGDPKQKDVWKLRTFDAVICEVNADFKTERIPPGIYTVIAEAYKELTEEKSRHRGRRLPDYVGAMKVEVPKEGPTPRVHVEMKTREEFRKHLRASGIGGAAPGPSGEIKDMDPVAFLSHLRRTRDGTCTVAGVTGVWVKEDHLPKLFELLDSEEKCAPVVHALWSPHVDIGKPTTIGREAGFLIRSFRTQEYPAPLGSTMSEADKEELREWWKQYQDRKD